MITYRYRYGLPFCIDWEGDVDSAELNGENLLNKYRPENKCFEFAAADAEELGAGIVIINGEEAIELICS